MGHKEMETIGMSMESKADLFEKKHPVVRELEEIPEVLFEEQMGQLPSSAISLKKLFTRKQMDENHVDCLILYKIAKQVLHVLMEFSKKGICPGLMDLEDIYVDLNSSHFPVFFTHPEKFQLLNFEQEYEWYPEDERIFGDVVFFDEKRQKLANIRLIYKILVASTKGNVKIPPKITEADYSELFYRTLPDEWKQIFSEQPDCGYDQMKELLEQSIEIEETFAKEARERLNQKAEQKIQEQENTYRAEASTIEKKLFCMIVLLRTELEESREISKMLYLLQDELETEVRLSHLNYQQAFVFGNGCILVKNFASYPWGFRCQCEQEIKDYSAGEALIIATDIMRETIREHRGEMFRMYAVTDGRLKNDGMFQAALSMIEEQKKNGLEFFLVTGEESRCEACLKLKNLMKHEEDIHVDTENSRI